MNYERLKLLRKHIAKTRRFDYAVWCAHKDHRTKRALGLYSPTLKPETLNENGCGTVGCVAGHAVALFGGPRQQRSGRIYETAQRLLKLKEDDARFLFYGEEGRGLDCLADISEATKKRCTKAS